jgi:formiminotetrahydrofolate cyclodeaminase
MNVKINARELADTAMAEKLIAEAEALCKQAQKLEAEILEITKL